jgi:5,10-methylenetetrahydrofolate reductase
MEKIVEFRTPFSPTIEAAVDAVLHLDEFDSILIAEEGGIDKFIVAERIRDKCGKKIYLKISCSDRNRSALYSQLATAASLGLLDLILVDGSHPATTKFPSAKPVYDLDALILLRMLKEDAPLFSEALRRPREMARWRVGFCIGGTTKPDIARAQKCISFGADLLFVHSPEAVKVFRAITTLPIVLRVAAACEQEVASILRDAEAAGADGASVACEFLGGQ